jgi:P pilus assembly chaperone PapD
MPTLISLAAWAGAVIRIMANARATQNQENVFMLNLPVERLGKDKLGP